MPKKISIFLILILIGFGIGISLNTEAWTCGDPVDFTYKGQAVTYGTVESQGQCWMDRNLGASQVATAYDDEQAYGDLFQWGRLDDGHQGITCTGPTTCTSDHGTTEICSDGDNPGHNLFITAESDTNYDWRCTQNNNLWQGVLGINNPCPDGWRIPTVEEWQAEINSWGQKNYNGAYASPLKLTAAGNRSWGDGFPGWQGLIGRYWSSTVLDDTSARLLAFNDISASMGGGGYRAAAVSVRCIYDTPLPAETCNYHNVWGWAWSNMELSTCPVAEPELYYCEWSCQILDLGVQCANRRCLVLDHTGLVYTCISCLCDDGSRTTTNLPCEETCEEQGLGGGIEEGRCETTWTCDDCGVTCNPDCPEVCCANIITDCDLDTGLTCEDCIPEDCSACKHDPTIGWISFSCKNCDTDPRPAGCPPLAVDIPNYGVEIDSATGQFSGHAWSGGGVDAAGNEVPVLGWLSFNITETGPPPGDPNFGTHLAQVSTTTGQVSGWARFLAACDSVPCTSSGPCANCGGWDGWIKLGNSPHQPWHAGVGQQVYIDFGAGPLSDFHGWAWGDDVVGWISFNTNNYPGGSDYKVMTDFSFAPSNQRPAVSNAQITGENYCTKTDDSNGTQIGQVSFSWLYKDLEGDDQERYWLQVATDSGFSGLNINCQVPNSITADPNTSTTITSAVTVVSSGSDQLANACNDGLELGGRALAISYNGNYYWRVASKAATGNTEWSDWVAYGAPTSFATPAHAWPWPDFTHSPSLPEIGQEVEFIDSSVCYDNLNNPYSCSNQNPITGGYNRYQWDFNNDDTIDCDSGFFPPHDCRGNVTTTYAVVANYIAKLYVTDDSDHSATCDVTRNIKVRLPLPEYREVRPRSQLDNFLARIVGIFR